MDKQKKKKAEDRFVLVLCDIRSAYNVGAIFRTADAAGVEKVYLTGYTPAPVDRFGRERKDIAKAALGAEKTVAWESVKEASATVERLRKEGFFLVALEQDSKAADYNKIKTKRKTALFIGNETEGLSREILSIVDIVAEIPMHGKKESLNVSVATGIALFRLRNI